MNVDFTSVVLYIAIFSFIYEIFHYLFFYLSIYKNKKNCQKFEHYPPVSVIIAAKNEAINLSQNLKYILEQDYPANYEVIVVNDSSTDDTELVLAEFKSKYPHLYYTTIPQNKNFYHGKKIALLIGIKAANNDILVFTDADCKPASKLWLKSIVENFYSSTQIVIAYAPYEPQKGLLDKIVRAETFLNAINYLGFALRRIPYMAVGRNMAYRKSFFFQTKGFSSHYNLLSGSDDLFVNENANSQNTSVALDPESFVYSFQPKTLGEFFKQKIRHLTTSKFYKFHHKLLLSLENLMRTLFYISSIVYMVIAKNILSLYFILAKILLNTIFFILLTKKLKEKKLLPFLLVYEIIQPALIAVLLIFSRSKKEFIWK